MRGAYFRAMFGAGGRELVERDVAGRGPTSRARARGRRRRRRRDRRWRVHRALDCVRAEASRSDAAHRRVRTRDRRLRRVGPQRRMVLGACSPGAATPPRAATVATPSSRCSARCSRRSTRSSGSSTRGGHRLRLGARRHRRRSRRCPRTSTRLREELDDHRAWGFGDDDYRELSPPTRARADRLRAEPRRAVHARTARRSIRRSSCTASRARSNGSA